MSLFYKRLSRLLTGSLLAAATSPMVLAQGLGNSPYSALGLGEPYTQANVTNLGMGGLGISNSNPFNLNLQNPALLGTRPPYTLFEVGLLGQSKAISQNITNTRQTQRDFGGNLGYLALAFPANSRWTMSLSLRPSTYVDYQTRQYAQVEGTIYEAEYNYTGRGGLNKASFASGFRVGKNIYVGAEASYLFGNVTNTSDSRVLINDAATGIQDVRIARINRINYSDVVWRLGAAWRPKLGTDWTLNIGATLDPRTRANARETDIYQQVSLAGTNISAADTLRVNSAGKATLPQQANFGISIERNNKLLVGVDVGVQQWSQYRTITDQPASLNNGYTMSAGLEYTPKYNSTKYWDLVSYRAGFQYNRLPYLVDGARINDVSGSVGLSLPIGAFLVNRINIAFIGGQRGALAGTQIREQYLRFALGFSLTDRWFRKPVID
ncbi:hypothetical protein BN8_02888 [Fibrisoma limi BUZ 3]|uniref:Membrane protein involved in aromatic hydrocarbon degradation n=1 Tax=Fibrisoma limi BUZ 3 TaxID=1185876 RepID=I2GIP2_9BACT|nr:hypothetical protein [Fibrisoma limi]CCH53767.1 hypothetical protein BN8_02888 [Fibrisoma limi BUZ 3]